MLLAPRLVALLREVCNRPGYPAFPDCPHQMYVPGKLSDVERVLIDVGTGYYVEKVRGGCWECHGAVWQLGNCSCACFHQRPLGQLLARGASRLNSEPWEWNGAPSGVLSTFARPRGLHWWAWSAGLAPE